MSRILVDQIRSNSASSDALTLDGSGNLTIPGNLTCSGNASISGTPTGFGGGQVKQFKYVMASGNTQTHSTTTYTHYTHLDLSITPTSATNLIVMQLCVQYANNSTNGNATRGFIGVSLDSGSSFISETANYFYRYDSPGGNDGVYLATPYTVYHSAVAGSTSTQNFKVYHKSAGSGSGLESTINGDGAKDDSTMFLWEITP